MTQKELKKLRRVELLEMLIEQTRRADALEDEVAELQEKLAAKELDIENAGSLADAAIKLNEVFAAADAAAQQYLLNIKRRTSEGTANEEESPKENRVIGEEEPDGEAEVLEEAEPAGESESAGEEPAGEGESPKDSKAGRFDRIKEFIKSKTEKLKKKKT